MQGQGGKRASVIGDAPFSIQRPQGCQKPARLGQHAGIGGREKGKARLAAPKRQFKGKARQVCRFDFGGREGGKAALFRARPQPVAQPFGHAPGPAAPLLRLGPGHAFGHQPRHAAGRVEARAARPAAIDHHTDIGQRQRGFRDRRGQHDAPPFGHRAGRGALGGEIHRPEQRAHDAAVGQAAFQQCLDLSDLAFAGQEGQHAALGRLRHGLQDQIGHGRFKAQRPQRFGQPARLDRKGPPCRGDHRRVPHQGGHRGGVQRG